MKKFLSFFALALIFSLTFSTQTKAFTSEPNTGTYSIGDTVTIELKAKPEANENAVSVNLTAEGLTILSYTPPSGSAWIGNIPECDNGKTYTSEAVCTSMAKTSAIANDESLGTITVKITGSTASLVKGVENSYSDGKSIRTDSGVLAQFTVQGDGTPTNPISSPIDEGGVVVPADTTSTVQTILIIAAVFVALGLIFAALWPKLKARLKKPAAPTPFQ